MEAGVGMDGGVCALYNSVLWRVCHFLGTRNPLEQPWAAGTYFYWRPHRLVKCTRDEAERPLDKALAASVDLSRPSSHM